MNKKIFLLPIMMLTLVSCRKTEQAFEHGKYNSPNFDNNYYTEWEGIEQEGFQVGNTTIIDAPVFIASRVNNFTEKRKECMCEIENKFSYGYLSKLYDGNLVCNGGYAMSRVQLNSTGYGSYFPKEFISGKGFGFSARGGTTIDWKLGDDVQISVKINLDVKFYVRREGTNIYDIVDFKFNNLAIETDNGGTTTYVDVLFDQQTLNLLSGADGMSMTFNLSDPSQYGEKKITDNYLDPDKEKAHFALMLYEVYFDGSSWR